MDKTFDWEMTQDEAAQLRTIIEQCMKAVSEARERIASDEEEFDRLRTETEQILKRDWGVTPNVETIL